MSKQTLEVKSDMQINKRNNYFLDIIGAGIMSCVIFVLAYSFLGFAKAGISVPLSYHGGDDFTYYALVKAAVENGWIWTNGNLGAPYGSSYFDQANMFLMNVEFLFAKILGVFIKDVVTLVNLQYLLTFCLCGISSFLVLRILEIKLVFAVLGGMLFGLSPYIFMRGIAHYCLSACYLVPFSILLCIWATEDDQDYLKMGKAFFKRRKNVYTIVLAILIANNGIGYYPFFTCFFLCAAALFNIVHTRKLSSIKKPILIVGFIIIAFIAAISPVTVYQMTHGSNLSTMQRGIDAAETYGLKIVQLFLPYSGHGIPFLQNLIDEYNRYAPLVNENGTAYLGLAGIIGFLLLLLYFFVPESGDNSSEHRWLTLFSRLIVCAILFATIGGFSSILSLVFRALRGYNRISIFIRFISVSALCIILQQIFQFKFLRNDRQKKRILSILLIIFTLICLFDQLPTYGAQDNLISANRSAYEADSKFINEVEQQLQNGDMVFQFPYHAYPEAGPINRMADYQHLTGYIHSKNLKWTYGCMKGRPGDIWNKYVDTLQIDELIDVILSYGFRGIYIDTRAYATDDLDVLQAQIEDVIRSGPTASESGTLLFYNLYPYLTEHPGLADPQIAEEMDALINMGIYRYTMGETVYFDGTRMDAHKYFASGVSGTESDFAWTDGEDVMFYAYISDKVIDDLELKINLKYVFSPPQRMVITCGDHILFNEIIESADPIIVSIPKEYVSGQLISLQMQFPNAISPTEVSNSTDTRRLAIGITSFTIQ